MTEIKSDPVRRRFFYGWWIILGSFGMQVILNGLFMNAYSAYIPPLKEEFGWSSTLLASAPSLLQLVAGGLGPIQGWLLDRFGTRRIVAIGVAITGVGLLLFSKLDSIPTFYATYLLVAVGTSLCGYQAISITLVHWFHRRRSMAMGLVAIGMSVGGLLVPVVAASLHEYGWRATAFASGILFVAIGFPVGALLRHKPEPYGYLPDGDHVGDAEQSSAKAKVLARRSPSEDFTAKEALRTSAFWYLAFGHASALLVVTAVTVHLVPYAIQTLGVSLPVAASLVSFLTGSSLVGQVVGGYLGDRFDKRLIASVCMIFHMTASLLLGAGISFQIVVAATVLHGLAWGIRGPLMQAIRADYFGLSSYGTIIGFSGMIVTLGSFSGPLIAGYLADTLGDYRLGFTILGILTSLGSVFFLLARKPKPPSRPQPATLAPDYPVPAVS